MQNGVHTAGLRLPSSGRPAQGAGPRLVSGNSGFRGFPPSPDKRGSQGLNCWAKAVVYTEHMLSSWEVPGRGCPVPSSQYKPWYWVSNELPWWIALHMCCHNLMPEEFSVSYMSPPGEDPGSLHLASSRPRPESLFPLLILLCILSLS